jgi:hypothetical protein
MKKLATTLAMGLLAAGVAVSAPAMADTPTAAAKKPGASATSNNKGTATTPPPSTPQKSSKPKKKRQDQNPVEKRPE